MIDIEDTTNDIANSMDTLKETANELIELCAPLFKELSHIPAYQDDNPYRNISCMAEDIIRTLDGIKTQLNEARSCLGVEAPITHTRKLFDEVTSFDGMIKLAGFK